MCVCVGGRECPAGTAQMVNLGGQKGVGVAAGTGKEAQVSTHTHHVLGETQIWACSPGSVTSHLCDLGPVGQPVGQHTTHTHTHF